MSANSWPSPNPEWRRLADQAVRALDDLRADLLFGTLSQAGLAPTASVIDSSLAAEAVFDLADQVPQWSRSAGWVATFRATLTESDPASALAALRPELELDATQSAAHTAEATVDLTTSHEALLAPFTMSTLVAARARAALLPDGENDVLSAPLVEALVFQARLVRAVRGHDFMRVHPHTMYQLARALWLCTLVMPPSAPQLPLLHRELEKLQAEVEALTERLLTRARLGGVRDTETVALVFCAALLALPGTNDTRYVIEALQVAADGQQARGDWPLGRSIGGQMDDTGRQLVLSTHEIAEAFAEAAFLLGLTRRLREALPGGIAVALQRAVGFLRESAVQVSPKSSGAPTVGWCRDRLYGSAEIDPRSTAAALRLVVTSRTIAEQERNRSALQHFEDVWDPTDYTPPYLVWEQYQRENEPDHQNPILPYLDQQFVQRARNQNLADRRPWARTEAMSTILFGPPGTTKTTIVKSMAQGLGWPLVTLSPGTFIRDGLEHVEQRAIEVFGRLQDLDRTVVLFDECDELFRARRRPRNGDGSEETRSISAFVTASMLPKLQDLRDQGQVFFVIATNYFDQIDSAAKRIGRIDRVVGVGWPDQVQRANMIRRELADSVPGDKLANQLWREAVDRMADKTRFFVRGELVEFASALATRADEITSKQKARVAVDEILTNQSPSIDEEDLDAFRKDAAMRSACHRPARGELS